MIGMSAALAVELPSASVGVGVVEGVGAGGRSIGADAGSAQALNPTTPTRKTQIIPNKKGI